MMKLAAIISLFVTLLALLLSLLAALGRGTPLPEEVAALHLGDTCELPCWIGITPGKTTLAEAERHLQQVYKNWQPVNREDAGAAFTVTAPNGIQIRIALDLLEGTQVVNDIQLSPSNPERVTLVNVIKALGESPKHVNVRTFYGAPLLHHEWYRLWLPISVQDNTHQGEIMPQQPVMTIQLQDKSAEPIAPYKVSFVQWHGFGAYSFEYFDEGAAN